MLTFLCLPKFENMIDREIHHISQDSKHLETCKFCFHTFKVLHCSQLINKIISYKNANVVNFVHYRKTRINQKYKTNAYNYHMFAAKYNAVICLLNTSNIRKDQSHLFPFFKKFLDTRINTKKTDCYKRSIE